MKKILIVGGTSLLGKYLNLTKPDEVDLYQTWYTNVNSGLPMLQMDICNKSQVAYIFERVKPEVVIHCSAVGSVDYTETHYNETQMVNVFGMENILRAAKDHKALFVYISTNAVFEGSNPPYSEESGRIPINRYGSLKRQAEDSVMTSKNWLIIRPFLLYGWPYPGGRQNWVTTILTKLKLGQPARLVDDVWWMPTHAVDMAEVVWKLIELSQPEQVYNVATDDRMTLYRFGLSVVKVWGLDKKLIEPIASESLRGIARRPVDTSYDLTKIKELGLRLSSVEEGLNNMKDWYKNEL